MVIKTKEEEKELIEIGIINVVIRTKEEEVVVFIEAQKIDEEEEDLLMYVEEVQDIEEANEVELVML